MKYLKLFLKESKSKVGITLIMLLGQVVGTLLIPYLIAGIVDNGILKGDMNEILHIGVQMIIVLLITTMCSCTWKLLFCRPCCSFWILLKR